MNPDGDGRRCLAGLIRHFELGHQHGALHALHQEAQRKRPCRWRKTRITGIDPALAIADLDEAAVAPAAAPRVLANPAPFGVANCGGELKIFAANLQQPVIEKILTHLGL